LWAGLGSSLIDGLDTGVVILSFARVFCPFECIVRISLKCSLGAHVEPSFQFLNVKTRFTMLAETCTLGISLPFCLESL
jgi:hypothetical protein